MKDSLVLSDSNDKLRKRFFSLKNSRDLARLLDLRFSKLTYHLYKFPELKRYTIFNIGKRSGGERFISAPATPLKIIQRKLNQVLQAVYNKRPSAHGFIESRSIITNAKNHINKRYLLNVDLEDFFPSISFGRVRAMFTHLPYELPDEVATTLSQICCWIGKLPQGAPTSPTISNMICAKLDYELQELAGKYRCTYTRYADDLTFSTNQKSFPKELSTVISLSTGERQGVGQVLLQKIKSNGFSVNKNKVKLRSHLNRQEVTGIIVNSRLNLRRKFLQQVRAMLHAWRKNGYDEAQKVHFNKSGKTSEKSERDSPSFEEVLRGKIEFIGMVRGKDDHLYNKIKSNFESLKK